MSIGTPVGADSRVRGAVGAVVLAALAAAAALAIFAFEGCGRRSADAPPDVLLVVIDTARADRCTWDGYERPTTPRMGAFAEESVVFTDAWSPSSWTFPAHVALFTGRRGELTGFLGAGPRSADPAVPMLAEILASHGYSTGCFAENPWIAPHSGLTRGFATYVPFFEGLEGTGRKPGPSAVEFLAAERAAGRRAFAYVNLMHPHAPYAPDRATAARFLRPGTPPGAVDVARTLGFPKSFLALVGREQVPGDVRAAASDLYDGDMAGADAAVGELLDAMRTRGLLERTLVIVAGDHGEGLFDHGWMEHGLFLHRELLRVPLLVRPPGGSDGRRVTDVVRLHDAFATVLEACDIEPPAGTESRGLLSRTSGRIAVAAERTGGDAGQMVDRLAPPREAALLNGVLRSVYDGRYHLIAKEGGAVQLFDVVEDPRERTDISASESDLVARLLRLAESE